MCKIRERGTCGVEEGQSDELAGHFNFDRVVVKDSRHVALGEFSFGVGNQQTCLGLAGLGLLTLPTAPSPTITHFTFEGISWLIIFIIITI